jgi:hypothetical protein
MDSGKTIRINVSFEGRTNFSLEFKIVFLSNIMEI